MHTYIWLPSKQSKHIRWKTVLWIVTCFYLFGNFGYKLTPELVTAVVKAGFWTISASGSPGSAGCRSLMWPPAKNICFKTFKEIVRNKYPLSSRQHFLLVVCVSVSNGLLHFACTEIFCGTLHIQTCKMY